MALKKGSGQMKENFKSSNAIGSSALVKFRHCKPIPVIRVVIQLVKLYQGSR
jgi:hypothetical protein